LTFLVFNRDHLHLIVKGIIIVIATGNIGFFTDQKPLPPPGGIVMKVRPLFTDRPPIRSVGPFEKIIGGGTRHILPHHKATS